MIELDLISLALKLKEGSPVIFPTDTVPALAVSPEFAFKLWNIKKRELSKPLILMGSSKNQLIKEVDNCAVQDALEMAERHWPGPLTMVLPCSGKIVDMLNPGCSSVGMRVPNNLHARRLIEKTGPLATTSANISGKSPCLTPQEAFISFPDIPVLGDIPWPISSGLASTVIKWEINGQWQILRRGVVIPKNIE